ncbi:putative inactive purple acid phosphatase 29 [Zostera marina]|uniref:Putative inactive purple acid phosphatase 29 n=1 Tax=Zostera marina TaxID=29655 RepID=A0A0K9NKW1_ZOSMR|nr:putative inactive purple acid phosphatase 29 [Zostera marina]
MHLHLSLVTLLLLFLLQPIFASLHRSIRTEDETRQLRFGNNGLFRILQVADMHYANGESSGCLNVLPNQMKSCSDLNTTAFVNRMILAVKPDLIVYTGDNIYGSDTKKPAKSLNMSFESAIQAGVPWVAVLGNHDQESLSLSREEVMSRVVKLPHTLSQVNPAGYKMDGFGNYNLEINGVPDSPFANKSVLNLYFLDSGDYSTNKSIPGYGWIKPSQQLWFRHTSHKLQEKYMSEPDPQKSPAPGIAYFHIPLPEFKLFDASNMTGVRQEPISSPSINSGFFTTMVESGDVKAAFVGHDHINDFCGELTGIHLCYGGGTGYHAYGKAGWSRRSRVVDVSLHKTENGDWGGVKIIQTRKYLDDHNLSSIEPLILWNSNSTNGEETFGVSAATHASVHHFLWMMIIAAIFFQVVFL